MKRIFLVLPVVVLALKIIILPGCANIVPPSGGDRDSIPPTLVRVNPGDSTRNFSGNRIIFTFDEFIDVQNIQQQMVFSPSPMTYPTVDFKLNTLTVKIKDSLESNTTYSINFGEAIRDYTEGNPLKGFTYTFSTGPYIDSLELSGNVILAETGKLDSTIILMLHTSADDSAVVRSKPRYIAKQDSKGNFVFRNLPPRTFYLYALKDESGTMRYQRETQLFAFADKPVVVDGNNEPITLYAYNSKPAIPAPPATTGISVGGKRKNTGSIAESRLRYQTNLAGGQQDLLNDLVLSFEQPLKVFDSTRITLHIDSIYTPVSGYTLVLDTTRRKLTLKNIWQENRSYHLVMEKEFAEDTAGKKLLKTDTLSFITKKLADYGTLKLKLRGLDMLKNPVLQVVLNDVIYKSYPLAGPDFDQSMFPPGEYELRILFDDNKNGKWDPGEFFGKHKQPEIVKPIERKVVVKPNFQNEYEINL